MKYSMKYFGSCIGKISGRTYRFDRGQEIEAEEGEFDEHVADIVKEPKKVAKKVSGKKVETTAVAPKDKG